MLVSATDAFCDSNKEVSGNSTSSQLEYYHSRSPQTQLSCRTPESSQHADFHHSQYKGKNHRSSVNTPAKSIFDIFGDVELMNGCDTPKAYTSSPAVTWSQGALMANTSTSHQDWRSHLFDSDPMFLNHAEHRFIGSNSRENTMVPTPNRRSNEIHWNEPLSNPVPSRGPIRAPKYSYGFDADVYASTFRLLNDESHIASDPLTHRSPYLVHMSPKVHPESFQPQTQNFGPANWNRLNTGNKSQQASAPQTSRQVTPTYPNSDPREKIVPSRNQIDVWRISQGYDNRTTFMIRNIPNRYTQKMLLECLDETHKGEYDFVYLRMDFKNHCNVGYAFINFINVGAVLSFIEKRVGRKWSKFNSDKICHLSYANIQGKAALIEKFRNSSVMEKDPSYRPKIFYSSGSLRGIEEPFPVPGKMMATNDKHLAENISLANRTITQHLEFNSLNSSVAIQQQQPCSKPFSKMDWRVDWQEFDSDTDSGISNSLEDTLDTSFTNLTISCATGNHSAGQTICKK